MTNYIWFYLISGSYVIWYCSHEGWLAYYPVFPFCHSRYQPAGTCHPTNITLQPYKMVVNRISNLQPNNVLPFEVIFYHCASVLLNIEITLSTRSVNLAPNSGWQQFVIAYKNGSNPQPRILKLFLKLDYLLLVLYMTEFNPIWLLQKGWYKIIVFVNVSSVSLMLEGM